MYQIEKGIPLPEKKENKSEKYPFDDMVVGDSFLVPSAERSAVTPRVAYYHEKFPDRRFSSRKVNGGVRVWRTK